MPEYLLCPYAFDSNAMHASQFHFTFQHVPTEDSGNGSEAAAAAAAGAAGGGGYYYLPLTPWQKLAIMLAGFAIVSVTVAVVACTIFPGGCLFPLFCRDDENGE